MTLKLLVAAAAVAEDRRGGERDRVQVQPFAGAANERLGSR